MANKDFYFCIWCDKNQAWWKFSFRDIELVDSGKINGGLYCLKHYNLGVPKEKKLENTVLRHKIQRLLKEINMADKNINDIRESLFETMDRLLKNDIELEKAKTIVAVAQTIINSAKVEVEYLKLLEPSGIKSNFLLPSKT